MILDGNLDRLVRQILGPVHPRAGWKCVENVTSFHPFKSGRRQFENDDELDGVHFHGDVR